MSVFRDRNGRWIDGVKRLGVRPIEVIEIDFLGPGSWREEQAGSQATNYERQFEENKGFHDAPPDEFDPGPEGQSACNDRTMRPCNWTIFV